MAKRRHVAPGVRVEKVRFKGPNGSFRGVGARVVFPDGWKITLIGWGPKGESIRNALKFKERGEKSE
jgi:hypothetical protein